MNEEKTINDILKRLSKLEKAYAKLSKEISNDNNSQKNGVKSAYADIIDEWNNEVTKFGIPKITKISGKRATLVSARIREYGKDSFHTCIEEIKQSSFLQGKTRNSWTGFGFDWMVLPSNFPKVLEGNYNDKRKKEGNTGFSDSMSSIPESWLHE